MTTKAEISARVLKVIGDHFDRSPGREHPVATESSALYGDGPDSLDFDSLDSIEIIIDLENVFGIDIDDAAADDMKTVGDLVEHVAGKMAVTA